LHTSKVVVTMGEESMIVEWLEASWLGRLQVYR